MPVMTLPFDLSEPPAEPPVGCAHPERWRWHYAAYHRHGAGKRERCACGERLPCPVRQFAVRGLLDACAGPSVAVGIVAVSPAGNRAGLHVLGIAVCRWCGQAIELRRVWGWVHREPAAGLILCRKPALRSHVWVILGG